MPADITIEDVTNGSNTGVFDKLMAAVNADINEQFQANRITNSDYASVYLGSMQAVLAESIRFVLQEKLLEAQIDDSVATTLIKSKQLEIAEQERLAKVFEVTDILPNQRDKLIKDIDVSERMTAEQEATGAKQRTLLDTEEAAKQYEVDNLLPEQLIKVQEEIDLLQTQDLATVEQIKATYTERVLKDKETAKLGLDNVMQQSEVSRGAGSSFVYVPKYEATP